MALSNAERQARYLDRLRSKAQQGVTPDEIVRAARLVYENQASDRHDISWEDWLALARQKRNRDWWRDILPDDLDPEAYEDFATADAALLLRVAAVVRAVKFPPA
jgi:hypothetical protein